MLELCFILLDLPKYLVKYMTINSQKNPNKGYDCSIHLPLSDFYSIDEVVDGEDEDRSRRIEGMHNIDWEVKEALSEDKSIKHK